jgi:PIN domain nuclease of toxin-antitoxin system
VILLDTHAWIWWLAQPEALSGPATEAIAEAVADGGVCVSCISVWEFELLVQRERLHIRMGADEWVARSEALPFLRFLPVDARVALRTVSLGPALHADPADRMIVATALLHGLTLVTKDRRIRASGLVPVVW